MPRINAFKTNQSITDIAYTAGLIDGEGCFHVGWYKCGKYSRGGAWHTHLVLISLDEILVSFLYNTWGGRRRSQKSWSTGKKHLRYVYEWRCSGPTLDYVAKTIHPYLLLKKPRCEVMMEIRKTFANIGSHRLSDENMAIREELCHKLRMLNNRYHPDHIKESLPLVALDSTRSGFQVN